MGQMADLPEAPCLIDQALWTGINPTWKNQPALAFRLAPQEDNLLRNSQRVNNDFFRLH